MALELIHISAIDRLLERGKKMRIEFVKRSTGENIVADDVTVTSIYGKEGTVRIKFDGGEVRKIHKSLITKIDNVKIYF